MRSDGSIVFNTKIDNSDVDKDLNEAKRKIKKANKDISQAETAKMPLLEDAKKLGVELDVAKEKLAQLQAQQEAAAAALSGSDPNAYIEAAAVKPEIDLSVTSQQKEVERLQKEWDKINDKVDKYDQKIEKAKISLAEQTEKAGQLSAQLTKGGNGMAKAMAKVDATTKKIQKRLLSLALSALVFSAISQGLREVREYMGAALKSNEEYTAQLAKLKGAMLTAFQPIYEFLVPVLISLMKLAAGAMQAVARVAAFLGGKSTAEYAANAKALYEEAKAIEETGDAAKKAQRALAGFDEINKLSSGTEGTSATDNSVLNPDFTDFGTDGVTDSLNEILRLVTAIAAGLLTWKIASAFTNNLSLVAGLALSVGGALLYATSIADAFVNGIGWGNFAGMLTGTIALVGGLALALGTTGAAVGALVAGIGMIVVSLYEWITTGELTTEALVTLEAGIIAVGVAVALFTGLWIPLLIAAVVGAVVAILTKGEEIKAGLQRLDDWLQTVFARDWTETFGPVLGGVLNYLLSNLQQWWGGIKEMLIGVIDFISGAFAGDWQKAWDGIKMIFKGCVEAFKAILRPVIDAIAAMWAGLGEILPESWKNAINKVVDLVNKLTSWINSSLTFTWDGLEVGGVTLFEGGTVQLANLPQIPKLAQGAVIPPNREFMAVLGDQKHGTNIEAPLETIQQAVALVVEDQFAGMMRGFEETVAVLRELLEAVYGIQIGDEVIAQAVNRYNRKMNTARGGA